MLGADALALFAIIKADAKGFKFEKKNKKNFFLVGSKTFMTISQSGDLPTRILASSISYTIPFPLKIAYSLEDEDVIH